MQQLGGALAEQCSSANQTFDNLGRPTSAVDERFYPAETNYNADGQVTRATDSLGQWRDFAYDNNDNDIGSSLAGFDAQGNYRMRTGSGLSFCTRLRNPITCAKSC